MLTRSGTLSKSSAKTIRYQENGFDLDLSYINDRIVAMSCPVAKASKSFRNSVESIAEFLDNSYTDHYQIFNLAPEMRYDYSLFNGKVVEIECCSADDHVTSLSAMNHFAQSVQQYLDRHPANIAFVHCTNGIERTGIMICCYLLYSHKCKSPTEAIQLFSDRRFREEIVAIDEPSFIRFLHYFQTLEDSIMQRVHAATSPPKLSSSPLLISPTSTRFASSSLASALNWASIVSKPRILQISHISMNTIPKFKIMGGCDPWFTIYQRGKRIFYSSPLKGKKGNEKVSFNCQSVSVCGDITIDFFHKSNAKKMFSFAFHTSFIATENFKLPKREIDLACRDTEAKHFLPNFRLDISFVTPEEYRQQQRQGQVGTPDKNSYTSQRSSEFYTICYHCRDAIFTSDIYVSTATKSYHWACLNCGKCGKQLEQDSMAMVVGDIVTCEACNIGTFFSECQKCHQPITDNVGGQFEGFSWHQNCFHCYKCQTPLKDVEFDVVDNGIYCMSCCKRPEVVHKPTRNRVFTISERKNFLLKLLAGEVEPRAKKGDLSTVETGWLIDWAVNDDRENVNQAAVKSLALCAYPNETIPGIRENLFSAGVLEYLLYYASKGTFNVHKEIGWKEVKTEKELGRGASAKVFKGVFNGKSVAVKVFETDHIGFSMEDFRKELAFMSLLDHENVMPCYGGCASSTEGSPLFILMEFMDKGSLRDVVDDLAQFMDTKMPVKLLIDIAKGMAYLHRVGIIHRDLKPDNVMVDKTFACKLTDFGISRVIEKKDKRMTGNIGTPRYMAPELLKPPFKYTEKADVYSFSMIIFELLTKKTPFDSLRTFEIPEAVLNGRRPEIPSNIHPRMAELMNSCWAEDPMSRPAFTDITTSLTAYLEKLSAEWNVDPYLVKLTRSPKHCYDDQEKLFECVPFQRKFFDVVVYEELGTVKKAGGEKFVGALYVNGAKESDVVFEDNGNGTYSSSYETSIAGEYSLEIILNEVHIKGSPFTIQSLKKVEPEAKENVRRTLQFEPEDLNLPSSLDSFIDQLEQDLSAAKMQPPAANNNKERPKTMALTNFDASLKCTKCQLPLIGEYLSIADHILHSECFVCSHCDKQITKGAGYKDGKFFCEEDYKALYTKKCHGCDQFILSGIYYMALNQIYHEKCFKCAECSIVLEGGKYCVNGQSGPFCIVHGSKKVTQQQNNNNSNGQGGLRRNLSVTINIQSGDYSSQRVLNIKATQTVQEVLGVICDLLNVPHDERKKWVVYMKVGNEPEVPLDENATFSEKDLYGRKIEYFFKSHRRAADITLNQGWRNPNAVANPTSVEPEPESKPRRVTISTARSFSSKDQ